MFHQLHVAYYASLKEKETNLRILPLITLPRAISVSSFFFAFIRANLMVKSGVNIGCVPVQLADVSATSTVNQMRF